MGQKETLSLPGLPVAHYCHLCYGTAGYHGVEVQGTQNTLRPHQAGSGRCSDGKEVTESIPDPVTDSLSFYLLLWFLDSGERPGQPLLGAKLSPALKCISLGWCGENGLSGVYMGCIPGSCRTWECGQCGAQMCRILGHLPPGGISRSLPGLLGH